MKIPSQNFTACFPARNSEEFFHEVISGEKKGITGLVLRTLFSCVEIPYSGLVSLRNALYERNVLRSYKVDVPVVSVGNLTLGGTGKTPMVAYLLHWALKNGLKAGIASRGYRRLKEDREDEESFGNAFYALNDEGRELALRFPGVPQEQHPDRVGAARRLLQNFPADLILLDDAFQHRRLVRDLDIVLLDSQNPFGYGRIFPRGMLREPVSSLRRAQIVALSRADRISGEKREQIRKIAQNLAPNSLWCEIVHRPMSLVRFSREKEGFPLDEIAGRKVFAFSGIAQPNPFFQTLRDCKAELVAMQAFPDHHHFTQEDLERITKQARENHAETILCTMKDLVKITREELGEIPLRALAIELEFIRGESEFGEKLREMLKIFSGKNTAKNRP